MATYLMVVPCRILISTGARPGCALDPPAALLHPCALARKCLVAAVPSESDCALFGINLSHPFDARDRLQSVSDARCATYLIRPSRPFCCLRCPPSQLVLLLDGLALVHSERDTMRRCWSVGRQRAANSHCGGRCTTGDAAADRCEVRAAAAAPDLSGRPRARMPLCARVGPRPMRTLPVAGPAGPAVRPAALPAL